MYDDHYGLSGRPFQLTPDPAFWFDTATHRKAMAYLGYGLSQGEGFIVITGDPGTGKTTLVGHLMATIDAERLNVIRIVTTQIEADDLLRLVAAGLDVDHGGLTKAQLLAAIERGLHNVARSGRRTLLVIDEAQSLPVASIEELRMLSNFQAGGYALLQIFLLGQPEFRQRLHGSDRLEQLRQRVIAMHHLDPMGVEEVGPYLEHRLRIVGWTGRPSFAEDAIAALHRWSGGIPRRLNQLTGRVMLFGAIEGVDDFVGRHVEQVIDDLDGDGLGSVTRDAVPRVAPEPEIVVPPIAEPVAELPPEPVAPPTPVIEPATIEPEAVEPEPLPMTPPPPPMPPRPIHLSVVPAQAWDTPPLLDRDDEDFDALPDARDSWYDGDAPAAARAEYRAPPVEPVVTIDMPVAPPPAPAADAPGEDAAPLHERIAMLETRLEEQEAALRRVLTLLVDWVESDQRRPDLSGLRAAS
ncbi:ExeA family protein [Sphingomonas sp. Leaf25]|uniref:ExeA family protein n=1 Tax=Sphingomonas sp. Leaf25 TaxID=1735692 RepID=UPI0006FE605D|nr:AAA family ATPase [Sphingomonas sp. Leaf25]KQN06810.1 general secretion pathway protein GspA [Sphingomonas sp. Leaf25]